MKIRFLLISFVMLISCTQNQNKHAKLIIPEGKMIDILFDVQLTETYLNNNREFTGDKDEYKFIPVKYYKAIFDKHQISKQQFDESLKFYQEDIPKLKILYDSVAKRFEYLKDQN